VEGFRSGRVSPEFRHESQARQCVRRVLREAGFPEEGQGFQVQLAGSFAAALAPGRHGQPAAGVRQAFSDHP
jgi:hypothetical protein